MEIRTLTEKIRKIDFIGAGEREFASQPQHSNCSRGLIQHFWAFSMHAYSRLA